MKYITLGLTACVAAALAAPTGKLQCHKVLSKGRMIVKTQGTMLDEETEVALDGKSLYEREGGVMEVDFFECEPPSGAYKRTNKKHTRGQVRSLDGRCLTVGGVDNRGSTTGFEAKNGFVTLEHCDEHDPRLQWWQLSKPSELYALEYIGQKGDKTRPEAARKDDRIYMLRNDDPNHFHGPFAISTLSLRAQ